MKALLTGHGEFAQGLKSALELITGPQEEIEVLLFQEDVVLANYQESIQKFVDANEEGIIFTDLVGGTPFNSAMLAKAGKESISVLGGANLPMLLEWFSASLTGVSGTQLTQAMLDTAKQGVQEGIIKERQVVQEEEGI